MTTASVVNLQSALQYTFALCMVFLYVLFYQKGIPDTLWQEIRPTKTRKKIIIKKIIKKRREVVNSRKCNFSWMYASTNQKRDHLLEVFGAIRARLQVFQFFLSPCLPPGILLEFVLVYFYNSCIFACTLGLEGVLVT